MKVLFGPYCNPSTAVCVDLANCEPKSCAHEYNYVVRLPIQPVYHIIRAVEDEKGPYRESKLFLIL